MALNNTENNRNKAKNQTSLLGLALPIYHILGIFFLRLPWPEYVKELASLDRDVILRQKPTVPTIDQFIDTIDVPAKTVSSLLTTHGLKHLNLLQVDTEGFDDEIIKMTFQAGLEPDIINFESIHLSPEKKSECGHLLASLGYRYVTIDRDTIAAKENLINE